MSGVQRWKDWPDGPTPHCPCENCGDADAGVRFLVRKTFADGLFYVKWCSICVVTEFPDTIISSFTIPREDK